MTDTIYSGSVTDFRRSLVEDAANWRLAGPAMPRAAALMAANYGYALAALLGQAESEMGHEAAARLASRADDILTNGDDRDMNADVMPAAAEVVSE